MKKWILIGFGLLFSMIPLTACSGGAEAAVTPTITTAPAALVVVNQPQPAKTATRFPTLLPGGAFQIVSPQGGVSPITLTALKNLPSVTITVSGTTAEGPKLKDVLTSVSVTSYTQVTLIGSGNLSVTLTADQITDQTIIDLSYHGVIRLASPTLSKLQWVPGVTRIVAK